MRVPKEALIIDIETTDTAKSTKVIAIGAHGALGSFYLAVDPDCPDNATRTISKSTMRFWGLPENAEARVEAFNGTVPLRSALQDFREFISDNYKLSNVQPYGNSNTFDLEILENAYAQVGIVAPWRFYNTRDLRTAIAITGIAHKAMPFEGMKHHALDDARHEYAILEACYARIPQQP